jgi:pyrroloquinoline-quinone synthase
MTIKVKSFIDEVDSMVSRRSLLDHPFYKAWSAGRLSLDSLRDYAGQYYQHVKAFPTYLSAVHAQTDDITARRSILQNLVDEEAGDPNHPELWAQFAKGLGLSRREIEDARPRPETTNLIDTFRSICGNRGTAAGLAALYAYESQIPEVSESKIEGLKRFYGIDDERTLEYFKVHIEADKEHAAAERELLSTYLDEGKMPLVRQSVAETLDALYGILDGVCSRHDIEC